MIIKLKCYGIPFPSLSNKEIALQSDDTIEKLIDLLSSKLDASSAGLLKSATFLVNKSSANKDTILKDGDEVLILYILGGG